MTSIADLPLQSNLDHVLSEADLNCLNDIREVLSRHGRDHRFGVTLLHRHFDVADDEIPVERTDVVTRTSTITMMKESEARRVTVATAWRLDGQTPQVIARCTGSCGPETCAYAESSQLVS